MSAFFECGHAQESKLFGEELLSAVNHESAAGGYLTIERAGSVHSGSL